MRAEFLCWILGSALACSIIVLMLWAAWFFRQWRCLDTILDMYQNANCFKPDPHQTNQSNQSNPTIDLLETREPNLTIDLQETRESKLANDLQQILNQAAWRENEALRGKQKVTELLSDLSHQLKTPLANIILDIELLESASDSMDAAQKQEFLSHAKAQASTMQWLLQSLIKASRLEEGVIQFQSETTYIKPTIAKAVGAVYAQASQKNMEICVEESDDLLLCHNPKWTAEAMANVLENAIKYSPANSQICIRIDKMDIYTKITVQDQGPGIPETEYNQIFQRFYRGKHTDTVEGMGLGLYLAQLILQNEQGYLTVDSKLKQGSKFHFFLLNPKASAS